MAKQVRPAIEVCKGAQGVMTNRSDRRLQQPAICHGKQEPVAMILASNRQISSGPGTRFRKQAVHMTASEPAHHPKVLAIGVPSTHDTMGQCLGPLGSVSVESLALNSPPPTRGGARGGGRQFRLSVHPNKSPHPLARLPRSRPPRVGGGGMEGNAVTVARFHSNPGTRIFKLNSAGRWYWSIKERRKPSWNQEFSPFSTRRRSP
jgi:hypothetical protein